MADIEFFFDPMCPWAWITSRWVKEVAGQRDLEVDWRFISLERLNESKLDSFPEAYGTMSALGRRLHRISARVRSDRGNEGVDAFYTACGELLHPGGRGVAMWRGGEPGDVAGEALAAAGLPAEWADAATDDDWDAEIDEETDLAIARAGDDVGTPIITFDTSRPDEATMFGPVINRIPRGEEAVALWDAMWVVARTPGMAEFKRSIRGDPSFS